MTIKKPDLVKLPNLRNMELSVGDLVKIPNAGHGKITRITRRLVYVEPLRGTAEKTLWRRP